MNNLFVKVVPKQGVQGGNIQTSGNENKQKSSYQQVL